MNSGTFGGGALKAGCLIDPPVAGGAGSFFGGGAGSASFGGGAEKAGCLVGTAPEDVKGAIGGGVLLVGVVLVA